MWSCGSLAVGFKIDGDVFTNLLNGTGDKKLSRDFYPDELGGVHTALDRVFLIDVEADRPIRKANGIQGVGIRHTEAPS